MTQIGFYENGTGKLIRNWPNWSGEVPAVGDMVLIHFGDNNEEERRYVVRQRVIDATRPDYIKIFVKKLPEEQSEITDEEFEELRRKVKNFISGN